MHILFFCRLFYPHGGGVERHVLEIGKLLVKKGHAVTVITEEVPKAYNVNYQCNTAGAKISGKKKSTESPKYSSSPSTHAQGKLESRSTSSRLARTISYGGIEIYRVPVGQNNWFKKFRIWRWFITKKHLIADADVVHAHDVFFWYFPFLFLYPSKPAYVTFHGYETVFPPSKKAIFVRKISEILAFGNICVGDFIRKWYGTKPSYTIYGGSTSTSQEPRSLPRHLRGEKLNLKIILIGRFEEDIGIKIYIDALDLLKNRGVTYEFVAYGEGSLRNKLEKYGKVYGYSANTIEKAIAHADVVFASSYLTILQVMAAKRLVCSVYDNPLKKDYLDMAPFAKWIIIESSGQKLAEKIITLFGRLPPFDNALGKLPRNGMIEQGYVWAKDQTWDKVTDVYLRLWNTK